MKGAGDGNGLCLALHEPSEAGLEHISAAADFPHDESVCRIKISIDTFYYSLLTFDAYECRRWRLDGKISRNP